LEQSLRVSRNREKTLNPFQMEKKYTILYYFSHREEKGNNIVRGEFKLEIATFQTKATKEVHRYSR